MNESDQIQDAQPRVRNFGCWGAVTGGCLLPVLLFFLAAALGDTGGPLVWPILAFSLGIVGLVIDVIVDGFRRRAKSKFTTLQAPDPQATNGEQPTEGNHH